MNADQNHRLTQTGLGTSAGQLLRHYWQPVALLDELEGDRPVRPVTVLGQSLVLFRDEQGRLGLIDRDCPHRGADLAYGRIEDGGLRCPFHGWLFDATGQCIQTPAEPIGSKLCTRIKQRNYLIEVKNGIVWAWLGDEGSTPSIFPKLDCFEAPASHVFAFKGYLDCNWVQALEVGIDPAHASFLHRFFEDEDTGSAYGKQFRGASADSSMPMTRVLREFDRPHIEIESTEYGMRLFARREITPDLMHVRVTNCVFPQAFNIPLSATMHITQWHVPIDDTRCYWYALFTSFTDPVDKLLMREQRLQLYTLPDYMPRLNRANQWGYNAIEQKNQTYTGMGFDINVHDAWAVESQGKIQDRTREHLGTTDKAIMAYRRLMFKAMDDVAAGNLPFMFLSESQAAAITGPITVDGMSATSHWQTYWRAADAKRRQDAPWQVTQAVSVQV